MSAAQSYLESEVQAAPPQRLRLMLIETALRSVEQVAAYRTDPDRQAECRGELTRCRRIVSELLRTIRQDGSPLTEQMADLYSFLLRRVLDAYTDNDPACLDDIRRVLEVERETWSEVCRRHPQGTVFAPQPGVTERDLDVQGAPPTAGSDDVALPPRFELDA